MPKSKKRKTKTSPRAARPARSAELASRQRAHEPSLSRRAQAGDGIAVLNKADRFSDLRNKLRAIGQLKSEWAGIPMPLEDERLVIEPRYPYAEGLSKINARSKGDDDGCTERNTFYSTWKRAWVLVWNEPTGRVRCGLLPAQHHLEHDLRTIGCSVAWGIEQESKAIDLLGTLLKHHAFKTYLLTGSFLERSKRSGVTYLFRRLKPTVAIAADERTGTTRVLCSLCLHPIAYYSGSWAGAMCPTDDVVAHLMLMRGDEAMFWRRANQHAAHTPEAGL